MSKGATVRAAVALARAEHPRLAFDEGAFSSFVSERTDAIPAHGGDLLLVYLWSIGAPGAWEHLQRAYFDGLPTHLRPVLKNGELVREVEQELRVRLIAERRLLQYAGRGPLAGWLSRAALNTASKLRKQTSVEPIDPQSEALATGPELGFLKKRYRETFRGAFVEALATLSPRQRTVLRLNALSGVSIDELARMYRVHRATTARWIQSAREHLVDHTRSALLERLRLPEDEVEELLTEMRSQLDVSLARYLQSQAD